ncbi:class I SAM-dependent rRNA methyltransferase [Hippea jasoniae]|uniref:class I SAM-dependent rRNA methyltransferase n=1 Tax=Hippea jasoniae TaxID=944479 RepID=UPI00054F921F|nr:class I SAM-dependent rRNA methyltransferase [Hippea jasoniae]
METVEITSKGFEKLRRGEVWIYNKEIESIPSVKVGSIATLTFKSKPYALAFINPLSKITARVLTFNINETIDKKFFEKRIKNAIDRRKTIKNTDAFRLIHAEADNLPGLIVDKYADHLVVSFDSAGINNFREIIIQILKNMLKPSVVYERANPSATKEGLTNASRTIYGTLKENLTITEENKSFFITIKEGQKTGFYLDQRKNRSIIATLKPKKLLDLFAYSGGFGIRANADFTKFVEISDRNCQLIEKNCKLNKLKNYQIINDNVFDFLEKETARYDTIVIDPPPFAKNKKAVNNAIKATTFLIDRALKLLENNGFLAIFSCSKAVGYNELLLAALKASTKNSCRLETIAYLKQDIDHPSIINIPSSHYLSGFLFRKIQL